MPAVNTGPRLDRLPLGPFHQRILTLIGIGMFFDGFDIYLAANVSGAIIRSGFSTVQQVGLFVSLTFVGMMLGSVLTGFLGDRYGRRFTYQANLAIFGLAAIAAAFAPNMPLLILLRFLMGIGLGAENVVGYATMTEFVPPKERGQYLGIVAVFVVTGLPASAAVAWAVGQLADLAGEPSLGWRALFLLGGLGGLVVWWFRKALPESPRWLESIGRTEDAEALMAAIEAEAAQGRPLPPPAAPAGAAPSRALGSLGRSPLAARMALGCVCLVVINVVIYGFNNLLPAFFAQMAMPASTAYTYGFVIALGAPAGSLVGALTVDRWGRRPTIAVAAGLAILFGAAFPFVTNAILFPLVGLAFNIPVYVMVAVLFGIYIPELFPTEVRLRASGLCNMAGRAATVAMPFVVFPLFAAYGIAGVLGLMVALLLLLIVTVLVISVEPAGQRLEAMADTTLPAAAPLPPHAL